MSQEIIINQRGSYLHVKDEMFAVSNKTDETKRQPIAPKEVKTISMAAGTSLSTDVIQLALKNQIDIVVIDYQGNIQGRFWHTRLGSNSKIVKQQSAHSMDHRAITWVKKWIDEKLSNQRDFLQDLKKHRAPMHDFLNTKMEVIENQLVKIVQLEGKQMSEIADTLRGHEGAAARSYWQAISESLPKNFQFAARSRPAADAFNAMLNYAYGMLYNRVEQALLLAGIQPQIAFFHRDGYNLSSMTWDFIEPYRIWVEIPVFRLFSGKLVHSNHTLQMPKEVILTDEGKKLVAGQVITALDIDVIKHKGRNQVRDRILRDEAHEFANALLNA